MMTPTGKAKEYITQWCDKTYGGGKELGDWTTDEVMKFAVDFHTACQSDTEAEVKRYKEALEKIRKRFKDHKDCFQYNIANEALNKTP